MRRVLGVEAPLFGGSGVPPDESDIPIEAERFVGASDESVAIEPHVVGWANAGAAKAARTASAMTNLK